MIKVEKSIESSCSLRHPEYPKDPGKWNMDASSFRMTEIETLSGETSTRLRGIVWLFHYFHSFILKNVYVGLAQSYRWSRVLASSDYRIYSRGWIHYRGRLDSRYYISWSLYRYWLSLSHRRILEHAHRWRRVTGLDTSDPKRWYREECADSWYIRASRSR